MRKILFHTLSTMLFLFFTSNLLFSQETVKIEAEGLELVAHNSTVLNKEKQFYIYVPHQEREDERFPTVYILHGKWGDHTDWVSRADAATIAQRYRMILVFPDGEQFSWYLDSPLMAESQYESYISEELVDYIDENYPTIPQKEARGIMGLSMGGHGALMMTVKHPDTFGSCSSLSGILKLTNHPYREDVAERLGPWKENREIWEANSVWDLAEGFKTAGVHVLFDCGKDDVKTGAIWDSRLLHERLLQLEVPHIWREHSGTHSWEYWTEHLPDHLNFHQAHTIKTWEDQGAEEKWFIYYYNRMKIFFGENEQLELTTPEKPTVALLGSSTIERQPATKLAETYTVYNRGITSDHLGIYDRGLSKRLEVSAFDLAPDNIIIKIGRNDLGDQARGEAKEPTLEQMADELRLILDKLKERLPNTTVWLCTCAPVNGRYAHLSDEVIAWNELVKTIASEKEVRLMDLFPLLTDKEELFRKDLSKDGLHLNAEANTIWEQLIIECLSMK